MNDACPSLQAANESRRRAWRSLQAIRKLLAIVRKVPPAKKPSDFEHEGQTLLLALGDILLEQMRALDAFEEATAEIRPFISNAGDMAAYQHALAKLNKTIGTGPNPETLRRLCSAMIHIKAGLTKP